MANEENVGKLEEQFLKGAITRRQFVNRAIIAGASLSVVGSIVAACDAATATAAPGGAASAGAEPTGAAAASGSCGAVSILGNKKPQFGWAIGLSDNPIITTMQKTMLSFAGEMGWEPQWDSGTNANIQQMIPAVQAWITAGVPVLFVAAFEPSAFVPLMEQAHEKGLAWVTYVSPMEGEDAEVAFPPCNAAELIAEATVKWIKENNPTAKVLITSSPRQPLVACKWERVQQVIEEQTDAEVVAVLEGNTRALALQVTQAQLQAHPDLSVVIGTNDDAAMGAVSAFEAVGAPKDKICVAGFDGAEDAMRELKGGGYMKFDAALNLKRLAQKMVMGAMYLGKTGRPGLQPSGEPLVFVEEPILVYKDSPELDDIIAFYDSAK